MCLTIFIFLILKLLQVKFWILFFCQNFLNGTAPVFVRRLKDFKTQSFSPKGSFQL